MVKNILETVDNVKNLEHRKAWKTTIIFKWKASRPNRGFLLEIENCLWKMTQSADYSGP